MKKTIKMNIGGRVFHIDEDAYEKLNQYLEQLSEYFSKEEASDEIIQDIENRIAEWMETKISDKKQVVTLDDIEKIIETMGKPEDISEEYEEDDTNEETHNKKLFRDTETRIFGGVCSGLSHYLNIEVGIVRFLFILFTFLYFSSAIIYLILWIFIPPAISSKEKMQMKGKANHISDIQNNVKKEYHEVKQNLSKLKDSKEAKQANDFFYRFFQGVGEVLKFMVKFILVILGVALIISGLGMLITFTGLFVFSEPFTATHFFSSGEILSPGIFELFVNPYSAVIIPVSAVFVVLIPVVAILYGGLKLVLNFKSNDRALAIVGLIAWIFSLLILAATIFIEAKDYMIKAGDEEEMTVKIDKNQRLYLKTAETELDDMSTLYLFDEELDLKLDTDNNVYQHPLVYVYPSNDEKTYIEIEKTGRGATTSEATETLNAIQYQLVVKDSLVIFDPYYYLDRATKWKMPEVTIRVYIPENQKIYVDESMKELINYMRKNSNTSFSSIYDNLLVMTVDGVMAEEEKK